eukprot:GDKK01061037.1.p1 GENE.GDKK01061037.1~~GDKK01061037.1.p1  ORF type:complete len:328 (-),score=45.54 GDKK01061037.1:129-1091(-)
MKAGKKHCTKSLTNWSVDWDQAADAYEKAAKIYTHIRNQVLAREAWTQASNAHTKAKNPFFAARCMENLAQMLKEDEAYCKTEAGAKEVSDLYIQVSDMYALDNKPERQAEALNQAARVTPASDAPAAAAKILRGIDALEDSDKHHYTPDAYRAVLLILIRANLFKDAIDTLKRQIKTCEVLKQEASAAKAGLEIVILSLASGDFVLAEREFRGLQNVFGFPHSREQNAAFELIGAFEERDEEQLKEAQKNSLLNFLIPDVTRLAKKLKLSGVTNVPTAKPKVVSAAAPVTASSAAPAGAARSKQTKQVDEVEEEEDDLR